MEQQVIFREHQEQQAQDHTDLQAFTRKSIDHVVFDAVTSARRFSGFQVTKTAQTEVQIAVGRLYDAGGAVYARNSVLVQSILPYLPAAAKRIVSISSYGVETETEVEERDFLVNVTTGATEPQAVATVRSRDAALTFTQGAESADPQPPALPATHVEIARLMLDPTQVVSVTMMELNRVVSTDALDLRARILEAFKEMIEPRVASLASDLADLAERLRQTGKQYDVVQIYEDLARIKDVVNLPDNHSDYGADNFLLPDESDISNSATLGFDALVEMGCRFPAANADEFEISLFSQNDQNASVKNGLLLPKFTSVLKLSTGAFHSDLGIGQYGYQTYDLVQKTMRKERLRYGGQYYVCSNGQTGWTTNPEATPYWLDGFETYQTVNVTNNGNPGHLVTYYDYYWHDSWNETYWSLETIPHSIQGAQVAQSFLVANDMWATKLGFYVTQKAANENIYVSLCEVLLGVPDLQNVICHMSYPHANIVAGWNYLDIVPTFLQKGKRYALVFTANANHKFGLSDGQSYLDGTLFYSTDGAYQLGDLTKDLMIEVWGAKFDAAQVTIEFQPINLDGGLRNIDITARQIAPESTKLIYEVRPGGSGEWLPLSRDLTDILNGTPPLCQFRARFVGTADMMPALQMTGSRCYVWRPKTAFKHISSEIELASASDNITVKTTLEGFDETPHDLDCRLRVGAGWETPDLVSTVLLDASRKRYLRTFQFNLAAETDKFRIEYTGVTNSAANTYHIAQRLHYAL